MKDYPVGNFPSPLPPMPYDRFLPPVLLLFSNVFMTFAWYAHLKHKDVALWKVILASWGIAFFEYLVQAPANRIGFGQMSLPQLKMLQ